MSKKRMKYPVGAFLLLILLITTYFFFNFLDVVSNEMRGIAKIEIKGNRYVSEEEILKQLNISKHSVINTAILEKLTKKMIQHPYINHAALIISPPSKLIVHIREFEPVAFLTGRSNHFLGADGKVYPYNPTIPLSDLPVFNHINTADKSTLQKCLAITSILKKHPVLNAMISEIYFDRKNPQIVLKKNNIRVNMPAKNWYKSFMLLEEFYENNYEYIVSKKYKKISFLFDNKIICS